MLFHQKTYLSKNIKESFKEESLLANLEFSDFIAYKLNRKSQKNDKKIMTNNENNNTTFLLPIKIMNEAKKTKPEIFLDSIKMHINDNVKNIVLSNLTFQENVLKIFPQSLPKSKFQKTVKLFDEIK